MPTHAIAAVLGGQVPTGSAVTVQGWLRTRRDSKAGLSFLGIHDGSCFAALQVVAPASLANYQEEILRLTAGCAVIASGQLVESQGKGQPVELRADSVQVAGWVDEPETYPVPPKRHTFEYLRSVAHLRPRTNSIGAVIRTRDCLAQAIHRFLHERGYFWIHTPIITASDCEGAGELFRVSTLDLANLPRTEAGTIDFHQDFFGRETFLTVSGQLNVESYCLALSKVYTFGPTFRAENSNTSRHLAEFWMVEPELAFADLAADADLAEALLKYIFQAVLEERADDMAFFAERIDKTLYPAPGKCDHCRPSHAWITVRPFKYWSVPASFSSFRCAGVWTCIRARALSGRKIRRPAPGGGELPEGDQGFYMRLNDDGRTVAAMDVLAPGIGEIIGGSQREERLAVLDARMDEQSLNKEIYSLVPGLAPLWHRPPCGLWPGLRTHRQLCDRHEQCAGCDSVPEDAGECGVLSKGF